ncbi:hypothetical protein M422DRAFT_781768 [Sphaerobolus stellatus SS14]|uniref:Vacuole protein n=1 Tax=Sphaerobolus stellatus (strain SS14) TaxID=990650 RepID=A0A0C9VIQ7_SPHS4|nr:hypothetical protein M422DRAFT_781768 [Sphaerobolus stellatus SS14]
MCGNGPQWKREVVQDHKFDFIDVREFHSKAFGTRMKYFFLYCVVFKSFLVYMSDIFTAITYLSTQNWQTTIQTSCDSNVTNGCIVIPFDVAKWLFVGCIIFSFLLLAYEAHKAKKIIASRDISYSFTNVMAQNYFSLRSYNHFCLFCQISSSTKKKDDFAFFIFFTFKNWKRLLLLFTVVVFIISLLLLIAAGVFYIPLLCYIRGNLKEYCCHKIDKRIADLIKRKTKQRVAKQVALAKKEAAGDFSHLKNREPALPQPTLPSVSLDDDEDITSVKQRYPQSIATSNWQPDYKSEQSYPSDYPDYPPMPEYQPYSHTQPQGAYVAYGHSMGTLPQEDSYDKYDDNDYGSTYNLAAAAAPIAHHQYSSSNLHVSQSSSGILTGTPTSDVYGGYIQGSAQPGVAQYDQRQLGGGQYDQRQPGGGQYDQQQPGGGQYDQYDPRQQGYGPRGGHDYPGSYAT